MKITNFKIIKETEDYLYAEIYIKFFRKKKYIIYAERPFLSSWYFLNNGELVDGGVYNLYTSSLAQQALNEPRHSLDILGKKTVAK